MFSTQNIAMPDTGQAPRRSRSRAVPMFALAAGVAAASLGALTWYHGHTPVALLKDHYPELVFVTTEARENRDGALALCGSAWPRDGSGDASALRVIALPNDGGYLLEKAASEAPTPEQISHFAETWSIYCSSTQYKPAGIYTS
jgi:hypothetical protein